MPAAKTCKRCIIVASSDVRASFGSARFLEGFLFLCAFACFFVFGFFLVFFVSFSCVCSALSPTRPVQPGPVPLAAAELQGGHKQPRPVNWRLFEVLCVLGPWPWFPRLPGPGPLGRLPPLPPPPFYFFWGRSFCVVGLDGPVSPASLALPREQAKSSFVALPRALAKPFVASRFAQATTDNGPLRPRRLGA